METFVHTAWLETIWPSGGTNLSTESHNATHKMIPDCDFVILGVMINTKVQNLKNDVEILEDTGNTSRTVPHVGILRFWFKKHTLCTVSLSFSSPNEGLTPAPWKEMRKSFYIYIPYIHLL